MDKKLTKHGNSLALIIDKPILKLLKMNESTSLKLSIDGNSLVITPSKVSKTKKDTVTIAKKILKTHNTTFKKLAKT